MPADPRSAHTACNPARYQASDDQVVEGADDREELANLAPAIKVGNTYYSLVDWAYNNLGHKHYILLNGYNGEWNGTHGPHLWFADGVGGLGGQTGVFYDEQYSTYMEISHLYDYIVW